MDRRHLALDTGARNIPLTSSLKAASVWAYAAVLFLALAYLHLITGSTGEYERLAESFLRGKLYFTDPTMGVGDTALFNGHLFWPQGPFPAVAMLPFVLLGYFPHGILSFTVSLAAFYLPFVLAKRYEYNSSEACWFGIAFVFGTSLIGTLSSFWGGFSPHALACLFLFLSILVFEGRRRWWLIGAFVGLAMMNRAPAGLNILFFFSFLLAAGKEKIGPVVQLCVSFGAFVAVLALYNYARFGNPLESGYGIQIHNSGVLYSVFNIPGNQAGPLLSWRYLAQNIRVFLFGLPDVRAVGTSAFIVSPYLIYLFRTRWDLTAKLISANCVAVLAVLLCFRSTGFEQMGYRFSLDFLPFVFWLMIRSRIPISKPFKALIILASIVDAALVLYFLGTGIERRGLG